jgi:putative endonuclease
MRKRHAWTYILECSDGTYYVGSTTDIEGRVWEHNAGLGCPYTSRRRPVKLVYTEEFPSIQEAYDWERRIKGWRRAKKEALVRGEYESLHELARRRPGRAKRRNCQ